MSQKHDIGWKKRHKPIQARDSRINGTALALNLVNRGLVGIHILDYSKYARSPRSHS